MSKHELSIIKSVGLTYDGEIARIDKPKIVDLSDYDEMFNLVTNNVFCAQVLKGRSDSHFVKTSLFFVDFDKITTIKEFNESRFAKYNHVIFCSKSHLLEKDGVIGDRFHVLFELSTEYTDAAFTKQFLADMTEILLKANLNVDKMCKNLSRLIFPSRRSGDTEPNIHLKETLKYVNTGKYIDTDYESLKNEYKTTTIVSVKEVPKKENKNYIKDADYRKDKLFMKAVKCVQDNAYTVQKMDHGERFKLLSALYDGMGDDAESIFFSISNEPGDYRNWESLHKRPVYTEDDARGNLVKFCKKELQFNIQEAYAEIERDDEELKTKAITMILGLSKKKVINETVENLITPDETIIQKNNQESDILPVSDEQQKKVEEIYHSFTNHENTSLLLDEISKICNNSNDVRLILLQIKKMNMKDKDKQLRLISKEASRAINSIKNNIQEKYQQKINEYNNELQLLESKRTECEADYEIYLSNISNKNDEGVTADEKRKLIELKSLFLKSDEEVKLFKAESKIEDIHKIELNLIEEENKNADIQKEIQGMKYEAINDEIEDLIKELVEAMENDIIRQLSNYTIDEAGYNYLTDKRAWEFKREENYYAASRNVKTFIHAKMLCAKVIIGSNNTVSTQTFTTKYHPISDDLQAAVDRTFHNVPSNVKVYSYNRMVNANNTSLRDYTIEYDDNGNVLNLDKIIESNKYPVVLSNNYNGLDPYYLDGTVIILPTIPIPSNDMNVRDKNSELFEYFMEKYYSEAYDVRVLLKFMAQTAIERRTVGKPALLLQGPRSCGKSLILQLFKNFFGDNNAKKIVVDEKYNSFRLAPIVYYEETIKDRYAIYNELKEITGASSVDVRMMHTDNKTFKSDSVPILTSNSQILKIDDIIENSVNNQWIYVKFSGTETDKNKYDEIKKYMIQGETDIDKTLSRFFVDWLYTKGFKLYWDILKDRESHKYRYGFEIPVTDDLMSLIEDSTNNGTINMISRLILKVKEELKQNHANPKMYKLSYVARLFLKGFLHIPCLNPDNNDNFKSNYIKETLIKSRIIEDGKPLRKDFDGTKLVHVFNLEALEKIQAMIELLGDFDIDFKEGTFTKAKVVQSNIEFNNINNLPKLHEDFELSNRN